MVAKPARHQLFAKHHGQDACLPELCRTQMTQVIVAIQARTSSTRLPAKVLLPIGGLPLAVLCAKRASNTGLRVLVATSSDSSDDLLVSHLKAHNIKYARGSLNDVLNRFARALSPYSDHSLIFRLTADNPFPDGQLLDEMVEAYNRSNAEYLMCDGPKSHVPHGICAELFRLGHLREANRNATSKYDREHVTPYIRRNRKVTVFEASTPLHPYLRSTIDIIEDYFDVVKSFEAFKDPAAATLQDLSEQLSRQEFQPESQSGRIKFTLGTAQLGMDNYGISARPAPPEEEAEKLIKVAICKGANFIDTARAYGTSERIIGRVLAAGWDRRVKICTKLSPSMVIEDTLDSKCIGALIDSSFYKSLSELRIPQIEVLMLHRTEHLCSNKSRVLEKLMSYKHEKLINAIGVSVQNEEELDACLAYPEVQYIQLPFNILDGRWASRIGAIRDLKKKRHLIIHARSVLLQGLLLSEDKSLWKKANLSDPRRLFKWLAEAVQRTTSLNKTEMCLRYLRSQDWIDSIIIGMESVKQLNANLRFFSSPVMSREDLAWIDQTRPRMKPKTLNPALWS